ncbi:MAG: hypothetical protein U9Q83_08240 [Bacteroidota bacterium]|nr:hypothetical protein [Bacteroidota bacterium]
MDKRAGDNDILYTNRIVLDLDLRKDLEAQGILVSDDDIKAIGRELGAEMDKDDMFKEYSFITFS